MVVMTYQDKDEDEWFSPWGEWTFQVEEGIYDWGGSYIEIVGVSLAGTSIPFDVLDDVWVKKQEDRIEQELFG